MFEVSWTDPALDELADAYVGQSLAMQDALAAVVSEVNARLTADPMSEGESRGEDSRRVAFLGPVIVWFEVRVPARVVLVYRFKAASLGR